MGCQPFKVTAIQVFFEVNKLACVLAAVVQRLLTPKHVGGPVSRLHFFPDADH